MESWCRHITVRPMPKYLQGMQHSMRHNMLFVWCGGSHAAHRFLQGFKR
jgi:hypothetical protein